MDDGAIAAYYAAPAGRQNLPIVLVVQEIFGVHEHIKDLCRRLAHAGYLAVAANLYERQGDASTYTDIPKLVAELVSKVSDEQVYADLDASLAWAARNGGDPARVAVTGFCWGGRLTWMYAAHNPAVKAGVAWYGKLSVGHGPLIKRYALDVAQDLRAPVLGLYGGRDASIPLADVDRMKASLAAGSVAARRSEIVVYPRPTTASWPTIVPTTTPRPPRTAGAACWTGSRTTSNSPLARTPITGPRGCFAGPQRRLEGSA